VATVDSLRESLFGQQPVAGALLAHSEDQLVGYALYFFTFSSFTGRAGIWLDDLYVRQEFRHQGRGRALIEAVARIGAERGCQRFEWAALNWNTAAIDFYRKLGARVMDDWVMLRLNAEGLRRVAMNGSDTEENSRQRP
jgi:GNAT superfamily N-acetyltransferase